MAILGSGRFGLRLSGTLAPPAKQAQVVLRTAAGRAYSLEVLPLEAVADLRGLAAVYAYARAVPAGSAGDPSGTGLAVGYVGKTDDMGRRHAEHAARRDFAGHGLDLVLLLRIAQARIRDDIERDLRETFNPVLNDLLRGLDRGELS